MDQFNNEGKYEEWLDSLDDNWKQIFSFNTYFQISNIKDIWKSVDYYNIPLDVNYSTFCSMKEVEYATIAFRDPNTRLKNLKPLAPFNNLIGLNLANSHIDTLDDISHFENIKYLKLSYSKVSSLDIVKDWPLEHLLFQHSFNEEEVDLKHFNNLRYLNLLYSDIRSLDFLKSLSNIEYLSIAYCNVKDITALFDLPKLKELRCPGNNIKKSELDHLLKIHPHIIIKGLNY